MLQEISAVESALAALRAVCVAEPEPRPVCVPALHAAPLDDSPGWFVNSRRVTVFPHCPRCASYALYRKDNIGLYECMTCGLLGIEESTARRLV